MYTKKRSKLSKLSTWKHIFKNHSLANMVCILFDYNNLSFNESLFYLIYVTIFIECHVGQWLSKYTSNQLLLTSSVRYHKWTKRHGRQWKCHKISQHRMSFIFGILFSIYGLDFKTCKFFVYHIFILSRGNLTLC